VQKSADAFRILAQPRLQLRVIEARTKLGRRAIGRSCGLASKQDRSTSSAKPSDDALSEAQFQLSQIGRFEERPEGGQAFLGAKEFALIRSTAHQTSLPFPPGSAAVNYALVVR
jgi:hypothetical protein